METIKFKTNIQCAGCIAKVTPELDKAAGENSWNVDIQNPDKVLTVLIDKAKAGTIKEAVEKAGFKVETLA